MFNRPYKCPVCFSVFRTESGMKSHLAHSHETPAALEAQSKAYEAKLLHTEAENKELKITLNTAMTNQLASLQTQAELVEEMKKLRGALDSQQQQLLILELFIALNSKGNLPDLTPLLSGQNNKTGASDSNEKPQLGNSDGGSIDSNSNTDDNPHDL